MSHHDMRTISVLYPLVITERYVALVVISAFVAIIFSIGFSNQIQRQVENIKRMEIRYEACIKFINIICFSCRFRINLIV